MADLSQEHREKAVEAAARAYFAPQKAFMFADRERFSRAIGAAEPHLQRMYFERFREAVLSEEAIAKARWWIANSEGPEVMRASLEAALDEAQELMDEREDENGGA